MCNVYRYKQKTIKLTLSKGVELAHESAENEGRLGQIVDQVGPHAAQGDQHVGHGQVHQVEVDGGAQRRVVVDGDDDGAIAQQRHNHVEYAEDDLGGRHGAERRRARIAAIRVVVLDEIKLLDAYGRIETEGRVVFFSPTGRRICGCVQQTLHDQQQRILQLGTFETARLQGCVR